MKRRNTILLMVITMALMHGYPCNSIGGGIDTKFPGGDKLQFGVPESADDKILELNTGDSPNNVQITVDDGTQDTELVNANSVLLKTDAVTIGDGTAADQTLTFDSGDGAENSKIFFDETDQKLKFKAGPGAAEKAIGSGAGGGAGLNMLQDFNFDMESGTAKWTASGGALVEELTDIGNGAKSLSWDPSAGSQTLDSQAVTISASSFAALIGAECTAVIYYKWSAGTSGQIKIQFIEGASTVKAETDLLKTAGSNWIRAETRPFPCPTAAVKLRLTSTTDAAVIKLDDGFLGRFELISVDGSGQAAQLSMPTTANCDPDTASTTYADLTDDVDCPGYTVDYLATGFTIDNSDFDNLEFNLSGPAGVYLFEMSATISGSVVSSFAGLQISDGTTSCEPSSVRVINAGSSVQYSVTYSCSITYTSALTAVKIRTQGAVSSGSLDVQLGDARQGHIVQIHYTPIGGPLKAVKPDDAIKYATATFTQGSSGFSTTNSAFQTVTAANLWGTRTLFGSASACTDGQALCVKYPNMPAGDWNIEYRVPMAMDATVTVCYAEIHDGSDVAQSELRISSIATQLNVTQTGNLTKNYAGVADREFVVKLKRSSGAGTCYIESDSASSYLAIWPANSPRPAPLLVNSVVNPRAGVTQLVSAEIDVTGATTCSILDQDGSWLSTCGGVASSYNLGVVAGTFTTAPNCWCNIVRSGGTAGESCSIQNSVTTSNVTVLPATSGGAAVAQDFTVYCIGEK